MNIKTSIKAIYRKLTPSANEFELKKLAGVELSVVKGSIRENVDQDDAWWFYLSKNHDVIYDIGCNIGYTALIALIHNSDKKLLLVDPNPKALHVASKNIINNLFGSRVQYMSAFVGDKVDDTIKFYTVGSGAAGSMYSSHAETASSINSFLEVKTVTLDHLYSHYDMAPSLVKIDVEGAETLVMQGSKKLAQETKCTFFVEMHNVQGLGMEGAAQIMLEWCHEMNYRAWYLKTATELLEAKTIRDRGKCHLLLMPLDKPYPEYLKSVAQYASLPNAI